MDLFDLSGAPRKNCPYCMAEKGFVFYMEPIRRFSWYHNTTKEEAWGYVYKCPNCQREVEVQTGP